MARTPDAILEEMLVLFAQGGDEEALSELVCRWQPRLTAQAVRLVGERDGALDVMQEAWMGIVRGLRRVEDPAAFGAWARRIVAHKAADWVRRRTRERRTVALDERDAVGPEADERTDGAWRVRAALAALDEPHRLVATLHYIEDLSVASIATVLEIPNGTVKSRLHTARERLREALERSES